MLFFKKNIYFHSNQIPRTSCLNTTAHNNSFLSCQLHSIISPSWKAESVKTIGFFGINCVYFNGLIRKRLHVWRIYKVLCTSWCLKCYCVEFKSTMFFIMLASCLILAFFGLGLALQVDIKHIFSFASKVV